MKHESMNIRRVIRANRLLSEQGHAGDTLGALYELAALRKDAERYRWLRDNPWPPILEADIMLHRNARWDAEIDAAMAATKGAGAA